MSAQNAVFILFNSYLTISMRSKHQSLEVQGVSKTANTPFLQHLKIYFSGILHDRLLENTRYCYNPIVNTVIGNA